MILWIALALFIVALCVLFQKRFEEMLAPVVSGAVLICYVLAMFRALHAFVWIAVALAAVGLCTCLWQAVRKKGKSFLRSFVANVLTPGLVCFLLVVGVIIVAALPHKVTHTDEIYVWAMQPLSFFFRDGFSGAITHLSPRFMTYTPGVHLFQWIAMAAHGEWNEGFLFLGLWLMYAAMLLPLTRHLTWKKAWWIPVYAAAMLLFPAIFTGEAYQLLRVDAALGLCLGYAAIQAWQFATQAAQRKFYGITLSLGLALLVLVKQPGIGWALFPMLLLVLVDAPKRGIKQSLKSAAMIFALPLATFLSWQLFCSVTGMTGQHMNALAQNAEQLAQGQMAVSSQDLLGLCAALFTAIATGSLDLGDVSFRLPQLGWLLAFLIFPYLLYRLGKMEKKTMRRLVILLSVGYALYIIVFYAALLTVFRPEWHSPVAQEQVEPLVSNIRRYGSALWYALLMLFAFIGMAPAEQAEQPKKDAEARKTLYFCRFAACLLALVILLGINWTVLSENLIPEKYSPNHIPEEMEILLMNAIWRDGIEDPEAIVMLASDGYPNNREWLQYALAPIKLSMPYDSDLSVEDFQRLLKNHNIQYFVSEGTENELYFMASECAEDGYIEAYTVYEVAWDGDEAALISYY